MGARTTPATELGPASAITSHKKYEIAFLEIERDGFLGETNKRRGWFTPGAVRWR